MPSSAPEKSLPGNSVVRLCKGTVSGRCQNAVDDNGSGGETPIPVKAYSTPASGGPHPGRRLPVDQRFGVEKRQAVPSLRPAGLFARVHVDKAPLAQSAERFHGKEKVNGSIPLGGSVDAGQSVDRGGVAQLVRAHDS